MKTNNKGSMAVFGIFKCRQHLENAVDRLKAECFRNSDISVLLLGSAGTNEFSHENSTKAPRANATGGRHVGGALGWLTGVGALTVPGIGPLVASGPIMAALASAGVGETRAGLVGALVEMGVPDHEAEQYETCVHNGGMLLSVHVDNARWSSRAKEIIKCAGAEDIEPRLGKGSIDTPPLIRHA
jgi:hypothetical protein